MQRPTRFGFTVNTMMTVKSRNGKSENIRTIKETMVLIPLLKQLVRMFVANLTRRVTVREIMLMERSTW